MKGTFSGIISILLFIGLLIVYVKYMENKGIYYPDKHLRVTPRDKGWDYEDVYFVSEDGAKLNGWFIPVSRAHGTVLFCHGNAGNISHRLEIIGIFHNLGLNVFIFDYRGYGRSSGVPSEKGFYRDARAAYDYLIKRRGINKDKLVIYGKSIGANVAIELAAWREAGALISESAFTSARDMAGELYPFLPARWLISIKYDALSRVKNIKIPKLIIHSTEDEIVPFSHAERLFAVASEPKEFYRMRGDHNYATLTAKKEFATKISTFLKNWLGD
jgi:hypothetical protein